MKELDLISLLKTLCPLNASVILGIDDDAAVLQPTTRPALACADMLMDGTHFLLAEAGPRAVGHKALAVNLSDIAAMGGRALSAFVSIALPRVWANEEFIRELYTGIKELALRFDVAVAGGDTNIWEGPLVINVTVLGETHPKGAVTRRGAEIGDVIFVSGPLGGSLAGHHLSFIPQLALAQDLMDAFAVHSMLDISDGLGKDLRTLTEQSGVAASLDRQAIPIRETIADRIDALQKAFCDGEDFELCFTLSSEDAARLALNPRFANCRAIGRIEAGSGLYWQADRQAISWTGYEHGGKP